jgi:Fe-S-cluster formation regulator IscX/YfhJ
MIVNDDELNKIAALILLECKHLFPCSYPDIPLNPTMINDALRVTGYKVDENDMNDFMAAAELKLAAMAPLNWNNYGTIAILLNQNYPDEDLLAISPLRIVELVKAFPNFSDMSEPDADTLDSIIYTWISLADEFEGFSDDEAWV